MMNDLEKSRVQEIVALHGEIIGHLKRSLEKAIRIGELLAEQKKTVQHGDWIPWMTANLYLSAYARLRATCVAIGTEIKSQRLRIWKMPIDY